MKQSIILKLIGSFLILGVSLVLSGGCSINQPPSNIENQSDTGIGEYAQSKRYRKNGIDIVYLTGTPYDIGLAHGTLCKREIVALNERFFGNLVEWKNFSRDMRIPIL